jgi:hypothetical protein
VIPACGERNSIIHVWAPIYGQQTTVGNPGIVVIMQSTDNAYLFNGPIIYTLYGGTRLPTYFPMRQRIFPRRKNVKSRVSEIAFPVDVTQKTQLFKIRTSKP